MTVPTTAPGRSPARARSGARPLLNATGRTLLTIPRVQRMLHGMLAGDRWQDVAERLGIRLARARVIIRDPAFRKAFTQGCEVLGVGERARNIKLAAHIRDQGFEAEGATAKKVALEAARYLDGEKAGSTSLNLNAVINTPGLIINLGSFPPPPPGTNGRKPLIEHEE